MTCRSPVPSCGCETGKAQRVVQGSLRRHQTQGCMRDAKQPRSRPRGMHGGAGVPETRSPQLLGESPWCGVGPTRPTPSRQRQKVALRISANASFGRLGKPADRTQDAPRRPDDVEFTRPVCRGKPLHVRHPSSGDRSAHGEYPVKTRSEAASSLEWQATQERVRASFWLALPSSNWPYPQPPLAA